MVLIIISSPAHSTCSLVGPNKSTGNKSFFSVLKQLFENENAWRLKSWKTHRIILRLRLSSYKLAIVTGKWYNIEKQKQNCNLWSGGTTENETLLQLDSSVLKI